MDTPKFYYPLDMRQVGDQSFILLHRLEYKNSEYKISVLKTFDFDGASIPRIFWSLIGSPTTGSYTRAACLHDGLYSSQAFPRKKCDELFLEAMKSDGVGYIRRNLLYNAVRMGGSGAYNDAPELERYKNLVKVEKLDGII